MSDEWATKMGVFVIVEFRHLTAYLRWRYMVVEWLLGECSLDGNRFYQRFPIRIVRYLYGYLRSQNT